MQGGHKRQHKAMFCLISGTEGNQRQCTEFLYSALNLWVEGSNPSWLINIVRKVQSLATPGFNHYRDTITIAFIRPSVPSKSITNQ